MIQVEQGVAPPAPRVPHTHQYFAALAHQKAGQAVVLRAVCRQLRDGMNASDVRQLLERMIAGINTDIAMLGVDGVGHA